MDYGDLHTFDHRPVLEEDHQLAVDLCQSSESYDQSLIDLSSLYGLYFYI